MANSWRAFDIASQCPLLRLGEGPGKFWSLRTPKLDSAQKHPQCSEPAKPACISVHCCGSKVHASGNLMHTDTRCGEPPTYTLPFYLLCNTVSAAHTQETGKPASAIPKQQPKVVFTCIQNQGHGLSVNLCSAWLGNLEVQTITTTTTTKTFQQNLCAYLKGGAD